MALFFSVLTTYILPFVFALSVLVFFHELGHYAVARFFNVKVITFSIGFGKKLWSRRFGPDQTEWALSLIPLGGFVRMVDEAEGDVSPEDLPRAFSRQSVYKRFAIVAAGPLVNLVLACFIFWGVFVGGIDEPRARLGQPPAQTQAAYAGLESGDEITAVNEEPVRSWSELHWLVVKHTVDGGSIQLSLKTEDGRRLERELSLEGVSLEGENADPLRQLGLTLWRPFAPPVFADVVEGKAAAAAGILKNDRVLSVDEKPISSMTELMNVIKASPGNSLMMRVLGEDGGERQVNVTPAAEKDDRGQLVGRIGVSISDGMTDALRQEWHETMMQRVSYGPIESIGKAVLKTWESSILTLRLMGRMVIGEMSWKSVSGPISIANYAGKAAQMGLEHLINLMAALSVGLGVLNLLPIPVLDGGRLMYYLYEIVRGKPLPERFSDYGQRIGLAMILALMAIAFFNDISRLI